MKLDIEAQYDKVYRYCYFKLHNVQAAEDVTQETFLRFLEQKTYQDRGKPLAFLYTIARNLCIDEVRRRQRERAFLEKQTAGKKEERYTNTEQEIFSVQVQEDFAAGLVDKMSLEQALACLSGKEQEMLLLRYVNEVPMAELSRFYGMSRFALYRKTKELLKRLEGRILDEE